jgi:hypothetical protein
MELVCLIVVATVVVRLEVQQQPSNGAVAPSVEDATDDWPRMTACVPQRETIGVEQTTMRKGNANPDRLIPTRKAISWRRDDVDSHQGSFLPDGRVCLNTSS